MKYRSLGKTGYKVSEIGYGAWQLGGQWGTQKDEDSVKALNLAIDKGVNFIDTAAGYGKGKSEKIIAEVLKGRSERVYVCTKTQPKKNEGEIFFHPGPYDNPEDRYPEKYLRKSIEERLNNLNVDKIDILLLHSWTRAWNSDPKPLKILQKLKEEGLIENIGISTPPADQNSVIQPIKDGLLDVVELIFNIFNQEAAAELLPLAMENNTGVIVRIPFEEGALTGKYSKDTKFEKGDFRNIYFWGDRLQRTLERVERLIEDTAKTDLSLAQIALLFILDQKAVSTVIPGMRSKFHVEANTGVSDLKPLSKEIIKKLRNHMWGRSNWIFH